MTASLTEILGDLYDEDDRASFVTDVAMLVDLEEDGGPRAVWTAAVREANRRVALAPRAALTEAWLRAVLYFAAHVPAGPADHVDRRLR